MPRTLSIDQVMPLPEPPPARVVSFEDAGRPEPAPPPASPEPEINPISQGFADAFGQGKSFKTSVGARRFAIGLNGGALDDVSAADSAMEEGITMAAQKMISEGDDPSTIHDNLASLFNGQTNRTNDARDSALRSAMKSSESLVSEAEKRGGLPIVPREQIIIETVETEQGDTVEINAKIAQEDIDNKLDSLQTFGACVNGS